MQLESIHHFAERHSWLGLMALLALGGCDGPECRTGISPITAPELVAVGDTVRATASWNSMVSGRPVVAVWTLESIPPGSQAVLSGPNTNSPSFVADVAGGYALLLEVTSSDPGCDPEASRILIIAADFAADAGLSQSVDVGTMVTLDGGGSVGAIQSYTWTRVSQTGSSSAPASGAGQTLTFTLDDRDKLVYELTVSDGTATDSDSVTVSTLFPVIDSIRPAQGPVGTSVVLYGKNFSPSPSQNTILFQPSVAATVLTATSTTLGLDVPAGAMTGPVEGQFLGTGASVASMSQPLFTVTTGSPGMWTSLSPGIPPTTLNGVATPSAAVAYAVGANSTIISTTDAGVTWSAPHTTNVTTEFLGVHFLDAVTGWAVGRSGVILHTTDGGATPWLAQNSNSMEAVFDVYFHDANTGWAVFGTTASLPATLRTTDGGATWTPVSATGRTFFCCNALDFAPDAMTGIAVGQASSEVLRTVDGGQSWTTQSIGQTATLWDVAVLDAQTAWVVGEQQTTRYPIVLKTIDGGANWVAQTVPASIATSNAPLSGIHVVDAMNATISGLPGLILRTEDGGANWVIENSPFIVWRGVSFPPANAVNGMVVGDNGIARRQ